MKKLTLNFEQYQGLVAELCRKISISDWRPNYVIGLSRGGLLAATMVSHYLEVPMKPLQVSLRDDEESESNLWMAEDAYNGKNILIVDDINDTGATFNWIMKDWPSGCMPNDPSWKAVWNNNVKFAVTIDNLVSKCNAKMDFVGMEINKAENDVWVEFPYEVWWK
jgi:uncharacterized protein